IPKPTIARLADAIASEHLGTLTLVIVNTVAAATDLAVSLLKKDPKTQVILLHSRFRGVERKKLIDTLRSPIPPGGRIVISTQVVEAGVDIDATILFTEAAPWSSICQRAGRCNRAGLTQEAKLIWFPPLTNKGPYDPGDVEASTVALTALEGQSVTSEDLLRSDIAQTEDLLTILRRRDFTRLFDTSPDLSGMDIDIAMFIRPSEDLDLTVAWIDPVNINDGRIENKPSEPWRCSVPITAARDWLKDGPRAWTYDPPSGRWQIVRRVNDLKPNHLVLVDKDAGGYLPEFGFAPKSKTPVTTEPLAATIGNSIFEGASEGIAQDEGSTGQSRWQRLDLHLDEAHQQASALLNLLAPGIAEGVHQAVAAAAGYHDLGKSHEDWQRGLIDANRSSGFVSPGDGPWAKSPGTGRLAIRTPEGMRRRGFRHELVSALYLRTDEGKEALTRSGVPEEHHSLAIYLVGAHHGHLRIQPRDPLAEGRDGQSLMGLRHGETLPGFSLGSDSFPETEVDLTIFGMGSADSWSRAALNLFERWGPFRLAWFELIVRMADWRSSAGDTLPEAK
ncbi:MAG: helicase-related protein, partial [Propionibacteriaceae bacterium]|nr:helicase-related protein [Propionibacteriaceae bacterium]